MRRRCIGVLSIVLAVAAQSCATSRPVSLAELGPQDLAKLESAGGRHVAGYTTRDVVHHVLDSQVQLDGDSLRFRPNLTDRTAWGAAPPAQPAEVVVARAEVASVDLTRTDVGRSLLLGVLILTPVAVLVTLSVIAFGS